MILTCPNCETQYFADDSTIGESGRTVKCAACDYSWFVGPEGEVKGARGPIAGAHEAYREKVRERRRRASRSAAVMAWLVVGGVFGAIIAGSVIFRDRVVQVWPQSAATFKAAGLEVNRFGLEFLETEAERYFDGTTPILEITGDVENTSGRQRGAPYVRVLLLDEAGKTIGESFAPVTPEQIPAGRRGSFKTRVENPPFEAFELELQFATESEVQAQSQSVADANTAVETRSAGEVE
ncbi:MJ0042-type zinc finger domain-containing protein [Henriciella aquimarina]|uniref:MJ0042-type zinc finger domain-containing protein n=1 Tax=Henriciella aquimarina TaxID=545261 RepID=UPI000A01F944|nr:MJ0042-type zinc finger domain-containing protein [Henriciella aquimarina]